jgi:deferrochelatase/peroxidase EfeB
MGGSGHRDGATVVSVFDDRQDTVRGIARILMAESGKSMVVVWEEALSLHRVQYNTEVLPDPDPEEEDKSTT